MPQMYPLLLLPLTFYFNYLLTVTLMITYFTKSPMHNIMAKKKTELMKW